MYSVTFTSQNLTCYLQPSSNAWFCVQLIWTANCNRYLMFYLATHMSSVPFNGLVKHVMRTYLQTQMHAVFCCFAFHDLCLTCFVQTIDFFSEVCGIYTTARHRWVQCTRRELHFRRYRIRQCAAWMTSIGFDSYIS